jgi:hypothetical protein
MLVRVAEALQVPIHSLFEGVERVESAPTDERRSAADRVPLDAVREMQLIDDEATREALRTIIRSLTRCK